MRLGWRGKGKHTACPDTVDVSAGVLPSAEMTLHVSVVVVIDGGRDESGVIDGIMPDTLVVLVKPFASADDDAAIWTRIQPIVTSAAEANIICTGQVRRLGALLRDRDMRAERLDGDEGPTVLRQKACGVGVRGEDDVFGADRATRRYGCCAVVVVHVYGRDGGVGLQVEVACFEDTA